MLHLNNEVRETYPTTAFGVMIIRGVKLLDPTAAFLQTKQDIQSAIRNRFSGMDKKQMRSFPPFSHYHRYYKKFKKTYHVLHQCESIAAGSRSLPNGMPLIQAMFMMEIKNQLLTAGYDCKNLPPSFSVSLADGNSSFIGIGEKKCLPPKNDIIFSAGRTILGSIICGPDHEHRIQNTTTDSLFAIYGVPGVTTEQMKQHLKDIQSVIRLLDPDAETDYMSFSQ